MSTSKPHIQQKSIDEGGFDDVLSSRSKWPTITDRSVEHPITEFHVFPSLSLELRRMIWKYSLPSHRVIVLTLSELSPRTEVLVSRCDTPITALQVCRESREVAKRYYQLVFATRYREARTYINFNTDEVALLWRQSYDTPQTWNLEPGRLRIMISAADMIQIQHMRIAKEFLLSTMEVFALNAFLGLNYVVIFLSEKVLNPDVVDNFDRADAELLVRDEVRREFRQLTQSQPQWRIPYLLFRGVFNVTGWYRWDVSRRCWITECDARDW